MAALCVSNSTLISNPKRWNGIPKSLFGWKWNDSNNKKVSRFDERPPPKYYDDTPIPFPPSLVSKTFLFGPKTQICSPSFFLPCSRKGIFKRQPQSQEWKIYIRDVQESPQPLHHQSHQVKDSPNGDVLTRMVVNLPPTTAMGTEFHHHELNRIRKPRILCLHGFRTSGEVLRKQVSKWPESVLQKMDLVFADGSFPAQGKSDVDGIFDPPFYEWFQFNKEFTEYTNFNECLEYIENLMIKHAPIDGFLGFSQGAILSAALPGLQSQGLALTKVPKVKFIVIIGGAKLLSKTWAPKAYASPIELPSIHFLGKEDFLRPYGMELIESCVDPVIIHHPKGHTVPRLDDVSVPLMLSFLDRIQKKMAEEEEERVEAAPEQEESYAI